MPTMNSPPSPTPEYEPGGGRMLLIVALVVVTALGGMVWSFFSRQSASHDAPAIKARHQPPSAQSHSEKPKTPPDAPKPATPAAR